MWKRVGSRCYDRGQFMKDVVVWRKGKWVNDPKSCNRRDKSTQTEEDKKSGSKGHENDDFVFYGVGYSDYDCTVEVVREEEFCSIV